MEILAQKGSKEARTVARRALKAKVTSEDVLDAASRALGALVGVPIAVRKQGLEKALKMLKAK